MRHEQAESLGNLTFTSQALKLPPEGSPIVDLGKRAWKLAYFASCSLLFMSANDFITDQ